jgi:hypothetical protein
MRCFIASVLLFEVCGEVDGIQILLRDASLGALKVLHVVAQEHQQVIVGASALALCHVEQAAELVKRLKPRMTIPMHYRKGSQGYEVLQTVEEFLQYFDGETICRCDGNSMEVGEAALPAVAVLTYQG